MHQPALPTFPQASYEQLEQIARLAARVRAAQRVYFTHRARSYLDAAKIEEAKLDAALAALPPIPPTREH
jgi:hypothetical protein